MLLLLAALLPTTMKAAIDSLPQMAVPDEESDSWYMVAQLADGEEELIPKT